MSLVLVLSDEEWKALELILSTTEATIEDRLADGARHEEMWERDVQLVRARLNGAVADKARAEQAR